MQQLVLALFLVISSFCTAQKTIAWEVKHPQKNTWIEFGTHGSVQEMLIRTGELPDPYVGDNEKKFGWIENYTWEFRASVTLSKGELAKEFIDLEMPNVDTYAKVYFNGKYLGFTENTYLTYRFNIKPFAVEGRNSLKLVFESPVAYQKQHMKEVGTVLPSPNDLGEVSAAPYCRKPQYQFGWDWALRITTIGMWKPASVIAYNNTRSTGKNIQVSDITDRSATADFSLFLRNKPTGNVTWESALFGTETFSPSAKLSRTGKITDPKLWWPRGHGDQHLYTDKWVLRGENGELLDSMTVRFGIRKSELIMQPDEWGTSYIVRINGKDIFCKGANYIPQDIFPARVTDASVRSYVETMKESNFNMVRVWGGGYYPGEAFFEACDESGIMVWQDFMFACAMYPGNDAYLKLVKAEFDEQIPRISSHPSVVLFNGNNEVDVAWHNWGFVQQYKLRPQDCRLIEEYYRKLFKELLPERVQAFTNTPYVHTSPLSNWGKDEYFNHGTMHYWGVWHGHDPIEDFGRKTGRFNAEYGFQSFPEFSTLKSFSSESEWQLESPVMKHHQKSYVGNGMIAKHADLLYGKTSDFRRFVYNSQLTQAVAVSMAISGHRTGMPRCSGTIFWQLNDCWPAPTWSSVDYFGNWKALQYKVREDYRDVAVLAKTDTIGRENYFLVSDLYAGFPCSIECEIKDLSGRALDTFRCEIAVIGRTVMPLFETELKAFRGQNYVLNFRWNDAGNRLLTRSFTHIGKPYKPAGEQQVKLEVVTVDPAGKKARVKIINTAFVRDLWIYSLATGVKFDRNFVDLLPGEHFIEVNFSNADDVKNLQMIWN